MVSIDNGKTNMKTCYLIGFINTKTNKVVSAQLASESAKSITSSYNEFPFDIVSFEGIDYQTARNTMVDFLASDLGQSIYHWIIPLIYGLKD
jgi:hypothetical protein